VKDEACVAGIDLVRQEIVPGRLSIWLAADPERLIEEICEREFRGSDERMPYFGSLWPAGEALAKDLLRPESPSLEGVEVLDLGCGVGVVGLAAMLRGASVTFFDWEPRSLEIVGFAAREQGLEPKALVSGDWRSPPRLAPFDLILAADVLYEARNLSAVAAFFRGHLAPGGEAWLADPGRTVAETFPQVAVAHGLHIVGTRRIDETRKDGRGSVVTRLACGP